jgi:hypothetical protein
MATAIMKERLRLAAARCIVHGDPEWWSPAMTDEGEFRVANYWSQDDDLLTTPADAANFLLLIAEVTDE